MPATHRPIETFDRFVAQFGHEPTSVATVLSAGFTEGQLRSAITRGLLVRARHGILVAPIPDLGVLSSTRETERRQHVADIVAALTAVGPGAMAAQDSAGLVVDVSSPRSGAPSRVELVRPGAANFDGPGLRVRGSGVPHEHRIVVDGIPTTSIVRTAVDLARGQHLASALIPLDAAARRLIAGHEDRHWVVRGLVHDEARRSDAQAQLAAAMETCCGWPGIAAVRRALPYVDPAAESPLESRSRGWFIGAELPPLKVGYPVPTSSGTFWADFCDPTRRIIGEADGWSKYGEDLGTIRSTLQAEKRRQAELEDLGWRVVRWTSRDARASVVSRMATALSRRH